eukprot:gene27361-36125_t
MGSSEVRSLGLVENAWKHLIENPLQKVKIPKLTILIDALDESDDRGVNLIPTLLDLYRISKHGRHLNLIVTTRRYPDLLQPLQDCWQNDFIQLSPQEVRGDKQGGEVQEYETSLMKTLTQYIRQAYPNTPEHPHRTVASAYSQIFDPICKNEQKNGHAWLADRKDGISKGYWSKHGDGHNRQAGRFSVMEALEQHRPGEDFHGGLTLKATIEATESTLVYYHMYPLQETVGQACSGFGSSSTGGGGRLTTDWRLLLETSLKAARGLQVTILMDALDESGEDGRMIALLVDMDNPDKKTVTLSFSVTEWHYGRARHGDSWRCLDYEIMQLPADRSSYQLEKVFEQCTGGRLICIVGNFGEGKSTIAAALSKTGRLDAYHFCVKADANRQDKRLIYRSLAYQLAMKHKTFQSAILDIKLDDMKTLSDKDLAWKHLVENPLQVADLSKITILIDALDEDEYEKDGVVSMLLELYRISKHKKYLNLIVTTRPKPERILKELQDCWQNDYIQFSPQEVRGSLQEEVTEYDTSLMKTLTQYIRQTYSNTPDHPHRTVASAQAGRFSVLEALKQFSEHVTASATVLSVSSHIELNNVVERKHRPGDDLHDGLTLKATIEASGSVVVCLDKNTLPLFRLW